MAVTATAAWLLSAFLHFQAARRVHGFPNFQNAIPNGANVKRNGEAWHGVGHVQASGGPSDKNPFGQDFAAAGYTWTTALCEMDSDGDSQSNGLELGDPDCEWASGGTPSRTWDISHPGFADSLFTNQTEPDESDEPDEPDEPTEPEEPAGPVSAFGSASDLAMEGGDGASVSLSFRAIGDDSAEFVVKLNRGAWLGFGVTAGSSLSMTGGGKGSDVVACTDGEVRRYWITSKAPQLNEFVAVPGSSCQQVSGTTTMNFTRKIAKEGRHGRGLRPGSLQQVIFAYGEDGGNSISFHATRFGGQLIDFATGKTQGAEREVPAVLIVHLVLMALAWGGCLPFGAIAARTLKNVTGGDTTKWFKLHKRFQVVGWLMQLLGFGAAIWYAESQGVHFSTAHSFIGVVVVTIGTLQPLNAVLRPHKTDVKTRARMVWEVLHKGLGWLAVVLGPVNVILGVKLAHAGGHILPVVVTAAVLAALCILPPVIFFLLATLRPNNAISRWLVGATSTTDESKQP